VAHQLELHRSAGLLLHDHRARSDFRAGNDSSDLDLHEIAPAQLDINRQVKERSIAQTVLPIKEESDDPYLSRFQRAFSANLLAPAFRARRSSAAG